MATKKTAEQPEKKAKSTKTDKAVKEKTLTEEPKTKESRGKQDDT